MRSILNSKLILMISLIAAIFLTSCSKAPEGGISVEIKNVEYKEGNMLLTVQTSDSTKNARIDVVDSQGQILCSKYKDLAAGTNQFELSGCKAEKEVKVSVSPPGQPVVIEDFKLELPTPTAKIENARYELTNLVLTFNANLDISNARVEVASGGNVLCTKYVNLNQGTNEFKYSDCGNEASITVSLMPPGGTLVTKDFKMELPLVKIQSALYDLSTLVLTLDANNEMKNTRIDLIKNGDVLCTKYFDLSQGQNQKRIDDCGIEEKLTISVTPVGGLLSTKDFALNPPLLKFEKGYRYDYTFVQSAGATPKVLYIYVTEETQDAWEGIGGVKERDVAYLARFKITKSDLILTMTNSLDENEVLSSNAEYKNPKDITNSNVQPIAYPFWFLLWKAQGLNLDELLKKKSTSIPQQSQSPTYKIEKTIVKDDFLVYEVDISGLQDNQIKSLGKIYSSTSKPYLVTNIVVAAGGGLVFNSLQKKDFSLSDFTGYKVGGYQVEVLRAVPQEAPVQEAQQS